MIYNKAKSCPFEEADIVDSKRDLQAWVLLSYIFYTDIWKDA